MTPRTMYFTCHSIVRCDDAQHTTRSLLARHRTSRGLRRWRSYGSSVGIVVVVDVPQKGWALLLATEPSTRTSDPYPSSECLRSPEHRDPHMSSKVRASASGQSVA